MKKTKEWNEFIYQLVEANIKDFQDTKEYEYFHNRELHLDEMLNTNLTKDEKEMVEEVMFELGVAQDHRENKLYEQGMKDCVMILKELGVI